MAKQNCKSRKSCYDFQATGSCDIESLSFRRIKMAARALSTGNTATRPKPLIQFPVRLSRIISAAFGFTDEQDALPAAGALWD